MQWTYIKRVILKAEHFVTLLLPRETDDVMPDFDNMIADAKNSDILFALLVDKGIIGNIHVQ